MHPTLDLGILVGASIAFCVGAGTCTFDLYRTLEQSDFQTKSLFGSWYTIAFIFANAILSCGVFLVSCFRPGEWVARVIGQDIADPTLRGLVVGLLVTAILRSQLFNYTNEKGAGPDAFYSEFRTLALRKLHLATTVEINKHAMRYQEDVRRCGPYDQHKFIEHVIASAIELLKSIHHDMPRRDRVLESFIKATTAISEVGSRGDFRSEGIAISHAMRYCGIELVRKEILDDWIARHRAPESAESSSPQSATQLPGPSSN